MTALTEKETDRIFDRITANGCNEMTPTRFNQAINECTNSRLDKIIKEIEKEKIKNNKLYGKGSFSNDVLDKVIEIIKKHKT